MKLRFYMAAAAVVAASFLALPARGTVLVYQSAVYFRHASDVRRRFHSAFYFERCDAEFRKIGNMPSEAHVFEAERVGAVVAHAAGLGALSPVAASAAEHRAHQALSGA